MGDVLEIDLNADVGESFGRWTLGDDAALMPYLTSANVACGFHAGDPRTILAYVRGRRRRTASRSAPRSATATSRASVVGSSTSLPRTSTPTSSTRSARSGALAAPGATVALPQAARCALPRGQPVEGQARAVVDAAWRRRTCCPSSASRAPASWRSPRRRGCGPSPRASSTAATATTAPSCPADEPGAVLDDPDEAAEQAVRLAAGRRRPVACACTVTRPAPLRSRPPSAAPCTRPASASGRSL